jgi:methyl-accepting chemotaxis protein
MKLGNKIRLTVIGAVCVLTIFFVIYMPAKFEKELFNGFHREVESLSQTVALGIEIGLKSGDIGATQSAIEFAKKYSRVQFVALVDANKSTISGYPTGFVYDPKKIDESETVVARSPVTSEIITGEVIIGASRSTMNTLAWENRLVALMFGVFTLVVSMVIAEWLVRQVVRPIRQLRDTAKKVAVGDLSETVNINSKDEIGEFASAFNNMIESLRETIGKVGEASSNGSWSARAIKPGR